MRRKYIPQKKRRQGTWRKDRDKKYEFYDGEIFIQPFAPVGSTETRLLLKTKLSFELKRK